MLPTELIHLFRPLPPIYDVDGCECFARSGRHLDKGALIRAAKGLFQIADGTGLDVPEPALVQRWEGFEACAELRRLGDLVAQRLRPR